MVWGGRTVGERYADACVIQRRSFGGGSVMVWGGRTEHDRTPFHQFLSPEILPEYAIVMTFFSAMLFRSSKLSPTALHSSRIMLDHMLRVLYVTT